MPSVDLGKVRMTDAELAEFILQFNGGLRIGKMEDGTPGYYKEDEETGEKVLMPFKAGGGGESGIEGAAEIVFGGDFNASTTSKKINLEKEYKMIFGLCMKGNASTSYPTVSMELQNTSYSAYYSFTIGSYRARVAYAFDFHGASAGEYIFSSVASSTNLIVGIN